MIFIKRPYSIVSSIMVAFFILLSTDLSGQDLENLLITDSVSLNEPTPALFTGTHVGNGQSVEILNPGELGLFIGHRFGAINGGFYEFFGLDQATMRLGFDYAFNNWLMTGFGRSTLEKTWDLYGKARFLRQGNNGMPLTATLYVGSSINTLRNVFPENQDAFSDRLSFVVQTLFGRQWGPVSVQFSPIWVHTNYDIRSSRSEDHISLGFSGGVKLTKRMSLTGEYYLSVTDHPYDLKNPLTIGLDLDTGGHLFQLVLSNSQGIFDKALISNTNQTWSEGAIYFGFNLVRVFYLKK